MHHFSHAIRLIAALALSLSMGSTATIAEESGNTQGGFAALPAPDTVIDIPGLGPCSDDEDRSLQLSSRDPVTILVHGCNGSAGKFRTLSEVLAFHGQQSACFSYDDRDSMLKSSGELTYAIDALSRQMASNQITVIGHSQGGLVARKALVSEREDTIESDVNLNLVTISAPLAGIRVARFCANTALRIVTLGINDLACWIISGDKWWEITYASDFIQEPGTLIPKVENHLLVATDETDSCRRYDSFGNCAEDDFVFTLEEQQMPEVTTGASPSHVEVRAGHVEIVGETGIAPKKLIAVLQEEGYIRPTAAAYRQQFEQLLASLYEVN